MTGVGKVGHEGLEKIADAPEPQVSAKRPFLQLGMMIKRQWKSAIAYREFYPWIAQLA